MLTLKRLIQRGAVAVPGAFNAISAMLLERLGFHAVYASGAALANSLGYPDLEVLTLEELVQQVSPIVRAVRIPVLVDADTGYGGPRGVAQTIRALEQAGAAGVQLEDQASPKRCGHLAGKRLIPLEAMVAKVKAACAARRTPSFLIIARTDARGVTGLEDAITRAQRYRRAGADLIFPEALESTAEFRTLGRRVPGPLVANMTEFGKTPYLSVQQFAKLGYRVVLFPMTGFRVMLKAVEGAMRELKQRGTQRGLLTQMKTRAELYALLRYCGT